MGEKAEVGAEGEVIEEGGVEAGVGAEGRIDVAVEEVEAEVEAGVRRVSAVGDESFCQFFFSLF